MAVAFVKQLEDLKKTFVKQIDKLIASNSPAGAAEDTEDETEEVKLTPLQKKQAELKVLDQSIDTTTSEGRLMFNIIGSFAEFEHDIRKARQMDGIRKARDKGVAFGRRHVLTEQQQQEIVRLNRDESFSLNQLANKYAVSHMTIYRVIKKMETTQKTHQDLQWVA